MIHQTTLHNGIRVVTDSIPHVETVSLGAWFGIGARYEDVTENGLSHVLEHMAFKGTKNRSALEISSAIESVGGYLNAYTSREATAYYARILKEDLSLAVDVLSDILQNSLFSQEELDKEKKVILQEIAMTQDTPDDMVFDYFQEVCYPNQALGRSILGPVENVQGFTPDQVRAFMKKHYSTQNMVFAAAGQVEHDVIVRLVESMFDGFQAHTPPDRESGNYVGGSSKVIKDLEQVHLIFGFNGAPLGHPDYYTQMLTTTIMGGGMSSRLFQEIREKRGLVYGISAFGQCHSDTGVFGIYAGTDPRDVSELLPAVGAVCKNAVHDIAIQEVDRAKAQIKASLLMSMESTTQRCERLAHHVLNYGEVMDIQKIVLNIESITVEAVQNYLKKTLNSPLTVTGLGKVEDLPGYDVCQGCFGTL